MGRSIAALGAATGVSAATAGPVPPTEIAINLTPPDAYWHARSFANLTLGGRWFILPDGGGKRQPVGDADLDADGNLKRLPGGKLSWPLAIPATGPKGAEIRCTYQGKGQLSATGAVTYQTSRPNLLRFTTTTHWEDGKPLAFTILAFDPTDPIRNVDCRETTMPADARFDPVFIRSLQGYKLLRFMQWQRVIENNPVTWATRTTPRSSTVLAHDGVSIEDIVSIGKQTGADIWICMPWKADDDYYSKIAHYVHDTLPAGQKVYVELSNEVWNMRYPAAHQAAREATDIPQDKLLLAAMTSYARRTAHVMDIWSGVYSDRPKQLVRVAATQNTAPRTAELVFGYKDTADHVDALATAPYFGHDLMKDGETTDVDTIFQRLSNRIDTAIDFAVQNRAIAAKYGKRFITYEGGQHVEMKDPTLSERVQRDPRMYDLYKRYIDGWRMRVGDLLTLYESVAPVTRAGWGLAEYVDQPLANAPKLRAVQEEMKR